MVWVDCCPQLSISLLQNEPILKLIPVAHTPLVVILTKSTVYVYNQYTLLPITTHRRSIDSLNRHGSNLNIKTKQVSVNTSQLQKLNTINLFIETDLNYLIIYQLFINYSKSLYELTNSKNDELLQTGLPLSFTSQRFSLAKLIKSATKHIMQGSDVLVNLENIEHFNNCSIEDELNNFQIEHATLSIFKILKIGIGILKYWLKQNSHNLLIFNNKNEKQSDLPNELPINDNFFQVINVKNFKNEVFQLSEFEWYKNNNDHTSQIIYLNFNIFKNYFLFINDLGEIWYMYFEVNKTQDNSDVKLDGYKIYDLLSNSSNYDISFNPQFNLILILIGQQLKLFKLDSKSDKFILKFIKNIKLCNSKNVEITWSSCGEFFILLDKEEGYWSIYSKFGNITFDSFEILSELNKKDYLNDSIDFLKSFSILILPNSNNLMIINNSQSKLYLINLLSLVNTSSSTSDLLFYNSEYINLLKNNCFIKFPISPKFKNMISKIENFNGNSNNSIKNLNGVLKVSSNIYNQLSISYGDHISVSTPYSSGNNEINHILWFNFRNYYLSSLNIINHIWFEDYLILINRFVKDETKLIDEIIVLDTTLTKYGNGGTNVNFDSDLIVWRHDFDNKFINVELASISVSSKNLIVLTNDLKIHIIELSKNKVRKNDSSNDSQDLKNYKFFIGLLKSIHLSTIKNKLSISSVIQSSMIDNMHFLFLLSNGDFYLLKNQMVLSNINDSKTTNVPQPSNIYDLIKINESIEFFKFQSIKYNESTIEYIYLFDGNALLIYDLHKMIKSAFGDSNNIYNSLKNDQSSVSEPIIIEIDNYQPLSIENIMSDDFSNLKSIDLICLENSIVNKNSNLIIKNRINHRLILNNFIEYDLLKNKDLDTIFNNFKNYKNFNYCLEILLFKGLTENNPFILTNLIKLIEMTDSSEFIYINCLRKIEIGYWNNFFKILETTPVEFMNRLIEIEDIELCYNYLIIYLNFKKEGEEEVERLNSLDSDDKDIILKIIKMLDKSRKWDWCFELCRFIKLLEPSGELLKTINNTLV